MGLIDHDKNRAAVLTPVPQIAEHRRGDQGLLLTGGQRAQVDDDTADRIIMDRVEDRTRLAGGPDRVAVHAQVADPQPEAPSLAPVTAGQRLQRDRVRVREQGGQRGVFLPVGDRIQAERSRLDRRVDLGRVDPQPALSRRSRGIDRDPPGRVGVTSRLRRVGIRAHLAQAHEIGVRIEDDQAQVRLAQQPLEDHAERVGLPRPGLTAEEGVPVEAPGVGQTGHAGGQGELAQRQLRAATGAALLPRP